MSGDVLDLHSSSAATDGGFIAIAEVATALEATGITDGYRLFGGIAVMLHVLRTGADVPLRATGDADYGVPPHVLRDGALVAEIERLGYTRTAGNRWERAVDSVRTAAVDLLVPAFTSRPRADKKIGDVVTTEVPGLAAALRRPPVAIRARFHLADGDSLEAAVQVPDAASMLALKVGARSVRSEERDATDLWRCLEVALADGVTPADFATPLMRSVPAALAGELGRGGPALVAITAGLTPEAASRTATRIQALLRRVAGL